MKFLIGYTITEAFTEQMEAKDFDEAKKKFDEIGGDAELIFIRDENGEEVIY